MGRYLIRRLIQAIPLLILLSIFMFSLIHLLPGGPEQVLYNPHLGAEGRAAMRARFGLDDPVPVQYLKWISRALVGDFGFSFANNQPVSQNIGQAFPNTLELLGTAFSMALVLAILLGVISAVRQGTITDYALTTISYFGIAMPTFLFGLFAQDIFGVRLHLLPVSGTSTPGVIFSNPFDTFLDHFIHLILPATVLAGLSIAGWSRYMRSSMIEAIKQDYIRTARAKGVGPVRLLVGHALRNAVIPLITVVALDFGQIAGGATITEGVFAWPGMGRLFLDSLEARDFPILLAMLLIGSVFVVLFNLLADVLYAVMDPRIRYA